MSARPHIIRLREPWEVAANAAAPTRVTLQRRFHRPTGLDARSHITLVVQGLEHILAVTLNSQPLALNRSPGGEWRGEIATNLPPQNTLRIDIDDCRASDPGILRREVLAAGNVRLEIHDA